MHLIPGTALVNITAILSASLSVLAAAPPAHAQHTASAPVQWCRLNAYPGGARTLDTVSSSGSGSLTNWTFGNFRSVTLILPPVRQSATRVQKVSIPPNSRVTVAACGCVQTGGVGKTWKRYVDPRGPNSDRLYHGAVKVPGARAMGLRISPTLGGEFVRISDLMNWSKSHVWKTSNWVELNLGYEDDQYDDNGYSGHDDGTDNQCANVGNAAINVTFEYYK